MCVCVPLQSARESWLPPTAIVSHPLLLTSNVIAFLSTQSLHRRLGLPTRFPPYIVLVSGFFWAISSIILTLYPAHFYKLDNIGLVKPIIYLLIFFCPGILHLLTLDPTFFTEYCFLVSKVSD